MLSITDEDLQTYAREVAAGLAEPDKKQLRFNEIIRAARRFYASDPRAGVREIVLSCDKAQSDLYVAKSPMWQVLSDAYGWMFPEDAKENTNA